MGAIVFGTLSACALGTALWVERRTEIEQRTAVSLIASEATRVIQSGFQQTGQLLAADSIQQLIHARWVRDPDIVRISVQLPDQTIIADTDTRLVGTRATQDSRQAAASVMFRETGESAAARRFIFPVQSDDRRELCLLVILVSTKAVMADFYLLIESTLRMAIPVLMIFLCAITALGIWLSRQVLRRVLPDAAPFLDTLSHGAPDRGSTEEMNKVIGKLEDAARRLRDLAAR
ncbi:MAG: hypothetical protein EBT33_01850 [Betaproteobacteria bacterium]|nr:hypothetical protein [Betaproteobacteria bacterium]